MFARPHYEASASTFCGIALVSSKEKNNAKTYDVTYNDTWSVSDWIILAFAASSDKNRPLFRVIELHVGRFRSSNATGANESKIMRERNNTILFCAR
jgi:hypothetical protein